MGERKVSSAAARSTAAANKPQPEATPSRVRETGFYFSDGSLSHVANVPTELFGVRLVRSRGNVYEFDAASYVYRIFDSFKLPEVGGPKD